MLAALRARKSSSIRSPLGIATAARVLIIANASTNSVSVKPRLESAARNDPGGRTDDASPLCLLVRDGDERLQLQEALLADALDVHQLFDLLEAAVLLPVLDDALRRLGADAGQRFELRRVAVFRFTGDADGDAAVAAGFVDAFCAAAVAVTIARSPTIRSIARMSLLHSKKGDERPGRCASRTR